MRHVIADPSSRLNWSNDWADPEAPWLAAGETIASRLWTITPLNAGTPVTPAISNATTDTVFVEGLMVGRIYHLTETVTTAPSGLIDSRAIIIRCDKVS